ncbi:MAG: DUF4189 domain-containing protein [Hyphomicrobiaceae bacterium]|nr:DUF4189 domain-containing protein [Hyphomicrobiaceae bacterium]
MLRLLQAALLALAVLAVVPGPGMAQGPTPADEAFWDSVKGSGTIAEYRAYLEAFPRGFYAEQARGRIRELEGSASNTPPRVRPGEIPFTPPTPEPGPGPRPGPPPASPGGSVLTRYEIIREVQERLYALNYGIKVINGQLSRETREAISAWQRVVKRPTTGDMTQEELDYLRTARPITVWGGIAFVASGAYGMVWNRTSRQDAENDAIAECRKYAGANGGDCKAYTLIEAQCGGLSFYVGNYRGRKHWGTFVIHRPTLAEARQAAVEACRSEAKVPGACQLRASFCANGSHL